jgi:hypothetical protein
LVPLVGLALHSEFQQVVCPPLRFLRSITAVICDHRPRCTIDFILIRAPRWDGLAPMRTMFTHSQDHGATRNMANLHTHAAPFGLRAIFLNEGTASINRTRM